MNIEERENYNQYGQFSHDENKENDLGSAIDHSVINDEEQDINQNFNKGNDFDAVTLNEENDLDEEDDFDEEDDVEDYGSEDDEIEDEDDDDKMNQEKSIDLLNTLIEINNDRIEGYKTASEETEEYDLKILFSQLMNTSQNCKTELVEEVQRLGGTPIEGTRTTGKFFRVWMDVKAALTGKNRNSILNSCEYGEDVAVSTYENVLNNDIEDITLEQGDMIKEQYTLLKADHDKVKDLRDRSS